MIRSENKFPQRGKAAKRNFDLREPTHAQQLFNVALSSRESERSAKKASPLRSAPKPLNGMTTVFARGLVTTLILAILIWLVAFSAYSTASTSPLRKSTRTESASDAGAVSTDTPEGRLAVFDDLWQTVADHYYTDTFHGVDWPAQRRLFRPLAAQARDARELYAELRRMLSLLQDAHTRVYAPEEKFDWQHPKFISIGISLREVEGRPTVFRVERGSQAQRAGIHPGDVIETIGGESASALLEKRQREHASSTPRAAHLQALGALTDGPPGTNLTINWRDANSLEHQAVFQRQWRERSFALRTHQLRKGIVLIEIDAFTQTLAFEFAASVRHTLLHARGLILDLRGNGGGDATAMAEIASLFLPAATRLGQFTNRQGSVALALETDAMFATAVDRNKASQIPLVILTSERTSSAAEIFVAALQHSPRVSVVGGQTCGCVLAVRMHHALPDGGELEVSELDYRTEKGLRLEGQGIIPDEVVGLTRRDLYAHRDRLLELARTRLRNSLPR